jgi:diguanylate cyclase
MPGFSSDVGNQAVALKRFFPSPSALTPRLLRMLFGSEALYLGAAAPSAALIGRVRREQLNAVVKFTPLMLLGSCLNAAVWAGVCRNCSLSQPALIWCGTGIALTAGVSARLMSKSQTQPADQRLKAISAYALALGLFWGVAPLAFLPAGNPNERLIAICISLGMMFIGSTAFSSIPSATVGFIAPIIGGLLTGMASAHTKEFDPLATLLGFYAVFLFVASAARSDATVRRCATLLETENNILKDELTQLPNRKFFSDQVTRALARLSRTKESFAIMCLDLDGFKKVNDTQGHAAGDQALLETARRLRRCTRDFDVVARLGGDEFALLAADISTKAQAMSLAQRIVTAFREPFIIEGVSHNVTISVGVALAPSDGTDGSALLRNADSALYAAKNSGKSGFELFSEHFAFLSQRATLEAEFERALQQGQLELAFEPCVKLDSLQTAGFRATPRWLHPTRGLINSAQIEEMRERSGYQDAIGTFLIEKALGAAIHWPDNIRLCLPLSPAQLSREGFAGSVQKAMEGLDLDPGRLEVEFAQAAPIAQSPVAIRELRRLRKMGVSVNLSGLDAGCGALVHLAELPLTRIAIGEAIVRELATAAGPLAAARICREIARTLGLEITARGVENLGQLEAIRRLGCDEAQGPLFGALGTTHELNEMMAFPQFSARADACVAA